MLEPLTKDYTLYYMSHTVLDTVRSAINHQGNVEEFHNVWTVVTWRGLSVSDMVLLSYLR